ncbi:MAG TPA: family 16 glycoside hydrolase [Polyangia bacterium]|jgi:hypothetical protein
MFRIIAAVLLLGCGCAPKDPTITGPFADDFERQGLGQDWHNTGGPYALEGGALKVKGAYNHPLWLKRKLPTNCVIELDATSRSPSGDIKVEAYGDGESFAHDKGAYTSSGYVFIFGGWHNSKSMIARQDEHAPGQPARTQPKVEVGRTYHMKLTFQGPKIEWLIDGQPFLTRDDPQPLRGKGHEYFGFDNWDADVTFDNLKITPAP